MTLLRSAIECRAAAKVELERLCGAHGIVMPRVTYDLRGRCAGVAYGKDWINFNLMLFRENFYDFIENVVPHELCHVWHDQLKLKGWAHGKEWKGLMTRVGRRAEKYHNYCVEYSVSRTGLFRYRCRCLGSGHMVSLELHRRVQEHPGSFACDKCQSAFIFVK